MFKRLKSLAQLGHLPKMDDENSQAAWLYGKLMVALLTEKMVRHARIFPLGIFDGNEVNGMISSSYKIIFSDGLYLASSGSKCAVFRWIYGPLMIKCQRRRSLKFSMRSREGVSSRAESAIN